MTSTAPAKTMSLNVLFEGTTGMDILKKFDFPCETERKWKPSTGKKPEKSKSNEPERLPPITLATTANRSSAVDWSSSKLSILDKPGFLEPSVPMGRNKAKRKRKEEREKTKGPEWFNLAAPELTDERKNDLEALQLRSALDPKQFYKRNSMAAKPKYFQVGRILDNPLDFYRSRVPRKQRKQTIADEVVAEYNARSQQ